MRVRQFIKRPKRLIGTGEWSSKTMPKTAFPLSKTRSYQVGKTWRWRVDHYQAGPSVGRLLTAYRAETEDFLSLLSIERLKGEHSLVARLEYHGYEPGWHCHAVCGSLDKLPVAIVKPYGTMRSPHARHHHRRSSYNVTQQNALKVAFEFFRIMTFAEDGLL